MYFLMCVCVFMGVVYVHACAGTHDSEASEHWAPSFISLYLILLRQGLSLNLELMFSW